MTSFKAKHQLPFSLFFKFYYQKCSLVGLKFPNLKLDFYKNESTQKGRRGQRGEEERGREGREKGREKRGR